MSDLQAKKNKDFHSAKTGIQALVDNRHLSCDQDLYLQKAIEQFRISLTNAFSKIVNETLNCTLGAPVIEKLVKAENSDLFKGTGEVFMTFSSKSLQINGCIGLSQALLFCLVEGLLGNSKDFSPSSPRDKSFMERPPTLIEQIVIKKIAEVILHSFKEGFAFSGDTFFMIENIAQTFSIPESTQSGMSLIHLPLVIDAEKFNGALSVTMICNQKHFMNTYNSKVFPKESKNSSDLLSLIKDTVFTLEGTICDKSFKNLSELLNLKVGETLILEHNTDEDIFLRCENFTIAQGKVGESHQSVAMRVTQIVL